MKPALLLTLLFLLFALATKLPLAFSIAVAEKVLDTHGNTVSTRGQYFISPRPGRLLTLAKTGSSTCPVTVIQNYVPPPPSPTFADSRALAVSFTRAGVNDADGDVVTDTKLIIQFADKVVCDDPANTIDATWKAFDDLQIQKDFLGIGDEKDHPNKRRIDGTFKIQKKKDTDYYELQFYPNYSLLNAYYYVANYADGTAKSRLILTTTEKDSLAFEFIDAGGPSKIKSVV